MAAFVASASVGTRAFLGAAVPRATSARATTAVAPAPVRMMAEMSKSVPFLLKPKNLDGWAANAEFDPLGISDYVPVAYLRESELKHGRICMLASVGLIVQELFTWGGSYFPKIIPPIAAHDHYLQTGMAQLLIFIGAFEAISYYAIKQTLAGKRAPGDFNFDPLNLGKDPSKRAHYEKAEIKNGRVRWWGAAFLLLGVGWLGGGVGASSGQPSGVVCLRCRARETNLFLLLRGSVVCFLYPDCLTLSDLVLPFSTTAGHDREYVGRAPWLCRN